MVTPVHSDPDPELKSRIFVFVDDEDCNQTYRIAGTTVHCPALMPQLDAFRINDELPGAAQPAATLSLETGATCTAQRLPGTYWICSQDVELSITQNELHPCLEIHELAICQFDFTVSAQPSVRITTLRPLSRDVISELILGPVLPLCLAATGQFLLHAAAVTTDKATILICGESGSGKSTLSAHLDTLQGVIRFLDDITALTRNSASEIAAPYPQLKLPAAGWQTSSISEFKPVTRLVILQRDNSLEGIEVTTCSSSETAMALLRHTVAAKLLGTQALRQNLRVAAELSAHLTAHGESLMIRSPDNPDLVPEIANRILTA